MRVVVQRVDYASVLSMGRPVASIEKGLLLYVGIEKGDSELDVLYTSDKIISLRIFEDDQQKMNLSLMEISGHLLVISQFTLLGDCRKGRRPSFIEAEDAQRAKRLYDSLVQQLQSKVEVVREGIFQQEMLVRSLNNGPVTLLLDSRRRF